MSDIPEIPKIEAGSKIPTTNISEVSEEDLNPSEETGIESKDTEHTPESKETPEGPPEESKDKKLTEFGERRNEDIEEEIEDTLNNRQNYVNRYLIKNLSEPEAQDTEVGKEQLLEIDRINQQIKEEGNKAKKYIAEISGKLTTGELEENKNIEEIYIKEVADWWGFTEDKNFSPETQTLIENNPDLSDLLKDFTPEEQKIFEEMYHKIFDTLPPEDRNKLLDEKNIINSILNQEAEKDRAEEFRKLMVRLAVKVSVKVAVAILKNIQKSSESKVAKVTCGTLADLLEAGGKELDKAYTGEINPEDLTIALRNHFFGET